MVRNSRGATRGSGGIVPQLLIRDYWKWTTGNGLLEMDSPPLKTAKKVYFIFFLQWAYSIMSPEIQLQDQIINYSFFKIICENN